MSTFRPVIQQLSHTTNDLRRSSVLIGAFACALCAIGCAPEQRQSTQANPDGEYASIEESLAASTPDSQPVLADAVRLRGIGDIDGALEVSKKLLIENPDDLNILTLTAELLSEKQQFAEAARIGEQMASLSESDRAKILTRVHYWYMSARMFDDAERCLRDAIASDPQSAAARRLLAQLLTAQGRRQESATLIRELIRMRKADPNELLSLVDLGSPFLLVSYDHLIDESETSLFQLGQARYLYTIHSESDKAIALTRKVVESFPDCMAAHAFLGRLLIESNRLDEFEDWLTTLPPEIELQNEYWYALGSWMALKGNPREAIRCFGEAIDRNPTDRQSMRGMIAALEEIGASEVAKVTRQSLGRLDEIYRLANSATAEQAIRIATHLQALGRPWESNAWLMRASQIEGNLARRIGEFNRRHEKIASWEARTDVALADQARLKKTLGTTLQAWPLPDAAMVSGVAAGRQSDHGHAQSGLAFADISETVGLVVPAQNGITERATHIGRLRQTTGSGLAVIDFDRDGNVDLYFSHAGNQPMKPQGSAANQLFRSLAKEGFADVSSPARCDDGAFGQGVAVGDLNQDGFPDLLIANLGENVAMINQGDGSFRRSNQVAFQNACWTASFAIADVNGDHLPDIIEVNYVDDDTAYEAVCKFMSNCTPQQFNPAVDRLYHARPDGKFVDVTQAEGFNEKPNFGLGVVVANFDMQFGNDVFISNDGDFNHFWTSGPRVSDDRVQSRSKFGLSETGTLAGCSIGRNGMSQAGMGIATGDFDRDGLLDMHVTNFLKEPVNLYRQTRPGAFTDQATQFGLYDDSVGVLGFGTQAADLDNDGWLDLAVVNGHVFGDEDDTTPFRMKPQLFRGSKNGFTLQSPATAGTPFTEATLGRCLVTLDWNRDGQLDLVANHLDRPISLWQNESNQDAEVELAWLQIELTGTVSERDAIGAQVRVTSDGQTWTECQTAGDGYMGTNEAVLHFGLGKTEQAKEIQVTWPSGRQQVLTDVPLNRRIGIIEGQQNAWTHAPF